MTYGLAIDNRQGSLTFGKEIVIPLTIIETPPMLACAVRAYVRTHEGMRTFAEAWMEKIPKDLERVLPLPEKFAAEESLKKIESNLDKVAELRMVMAKADVTLPFVSTERQFVNETFLAPKQSS